MQGNMPTLAEVAACVYDQGQYIKRTFRHAELRDELDATPGSDCRLQVQHGGDWYFHTGSSDYDQDHRGYWGSAFTPRGLSKKAALAIARDLLDQVGEDYASGNEEEGDEATTY